MDAAKLVHLAVIASVVKQLKLMNAAYVLVMVLLMAPVIVMAM